MAGDWRSNTVTASPSRTNSAATAAPIPDDPPVIRTDLGCLALCAWSDLLVLIGLHRWRGPQTRVGTAVHRVEDDLVECVGCAPLVDLFVRRRVDLRGPAVFVVDLLQRGRVLHHEAGAGIDEVGERVVAGAVPPRAPQRPVAAANHRARR